MNELTIVEPLRVAVAGCGGSRQSFGPAFRLSAAAKAVDVMDADMVNARSWSRQMSGGSVHLDFAAMLEATTAEAVLLASPLSVRAEQARLALASGRHVLYMPPFPIDLAKSSALVEQAASAGLVLMPAYGRRFDRAYVTVAQALAANELGDGIHIRCEWCFCSTAEHRREVLKTWRGIFETHASETIDLCRWWLGPIHTVSADIDPVDGAQKRSHLGNLILKHDRGVSVHHISQTDQKNAIEQYQVEGSRAALDLHFGTMWGPGATSPPRVLLKSHSGSPTDLSPEPLAKLEDELRAHYPYKLLLEEFVSAVREKREPSPSANDGYGVVEAIAACYLAAHDRTKVSLPLTVTGGAG